MTSLMQKSEYEAMFHSEERMWWYKALRHLLTYYIGKHSTTDASILDAGCGTGKNMQHLISQGYTNVEGIDFSPDAVEFCGRRGLTNVKLGSITSIDKPDNSFDVLICMDVLGSLGEEDRKHAAAEMYRVLKPGGLLLVHTAALEIFRSQHDEVVNVAFRFNRRQLIGLFQTFDLKIIKVSYRVFLLSPLVGLFKITKKIIGMVSPEKPPQTDQVVFPLGINWLLLQIQLIENRMFRYLNLPFGSSLFIALRKK